MQWEVVIGIETHAQLSTRAKIFSGAATAFGAAPNTQACAVDIALPGVVGGTVEIQVGEAQKTVRLTRAHLEEDAGKSLHEDFHGMTGIDLNRAGTPLLEIVSEPDMRSAAEAVAYAKT